MTKEYRAARREGDNAPPAIASKSIEELSAGAQEMADLMRLLSHPARLLIVCKLVSGEQGVSDLEQMTGIRQPALSREIAKLREAGLIAPRRQSKAVFYHLSDQRVHKLIAALCEMRAGDGASQSEGGGESAAPKEAENNSFSSFSVFARIGS